jgi:hypothetical protein
MNETEIISKPLSLEREAPLLGEPQPPLVRSALSMKVVKRLENIIRLNMLGCVILGVAVLLNYNEYRESIPVVWLNVIYFVLLDLLAFLIAVVLATSCYIGTKLCCCFLRRPAPTVTVGCVPVWYTPVKFSAFVGCLFITVLIIINYWYTLPLLCKVFFVHQLVVIVSFILLEIYKNLFGADIRSQHLVDMESDTYAIDQDEIARVRAEIKAAGISDSESPRKV